MPVTRLAIITQDHVSFSCTFMQNRNIHDANLGRWLFSSKQKMFNNFRHVNIIPLDHNNNAAVLSLSKQYIPYESKSTFYNFLFWYVVALWTLWLRDLHSLLQINIKLAVRIGFSLSFRMQLISKRFHES